MQFDAAESGYYELARAVAFANVSLDEPKVVARLACHGQPLGFCAYEPFVREITRALRYPGAVVPASAVRNRDVQWVSVFRPLHGFATGKALREAQRRIQRLLSAIIHGAGFPGEAEPDGGGVLIQETEGLTLRLHVATLSARNPPARVARGRPRGLLQPVQVQVTYLPKPGYPSLVYGVLVGGTDDLFNRLGRCQTCTRFILGRTDRAVRYCADVECRAVGSTSVGRPPSRTARYKRAQRERLRDWYALARKINQALRHFEGADDEHARRAARADLAAVTTEARQRLPECFRWGRSKGRAEAERLVSSAEEKVTTVRVPGVRS